MSPLKAETTAWSPGDEPLIAWFDANHVGLSGSDVIEWPDQGPNNYNATPPGTPPTLVTGALNGQPVVRFVSASSQYFVFAGTTAIIDKNTPFTAAYVVKGAYAPSVGQFNIFLSMCSGASLWNSHYFTNTVGYSQYTIGGGTASSDTNTGVATFDSSSAYFASCSVYDGGGSLSTAANYNLYSQGILQTLVDGAGAVNTNVSVSSIGAYGGAAGGFTFDGDIAEVILFVGAISSDTRAKLNGYFASKYGIVAG